MTFTAYDDDFGADRDKVRFNIGDTQQNAGPRPDKRNFSDEEIAFALDEEDDRINGASAFLFEILASEWASYRLSERKGETQFDAKELADYYATLAAFWRKKPGGASEAELSGGLITITRTDAYTDD